MREILFRGKDTLTGEWVEGWLTYRFRYDKKSKKEILWPIIDCPKAVTLYEQAGKLICTIVAEPGTEGQFTGSIDRNGAKIFEGDIVNIGEHEPTVNGLYCVFYSMINHCWALKRSPEYHHHHFTFSDLNGFAEDSEVVGNIHDNPELLEGVER